MNRTKLLQYPKKSDKEVSSQISLIKFKWLEYSKSRDAVFCYPCQKFFRTWTTKENDRKWKQTLSKNNCFQKHVLPQSHIDEYVNRKKRTWKDEFRCIIFGVKRCSWKIVILSSIDSWHHAISGYKWTCLTWCVKI